MFLMSGCILIVRVLVKLSFMRTFRSDLKKKKKKKVDVLNFRLACSAFSRARRSSATRSSKCEVSVLLYRRVYHNTVAMQPIQLDGHLG